jgi:mRNA interferase RelE/StbE
VKYQVTLARGAEKELSRLPQKMQLRIAGVLALLAVNPFPPNSKKLSGRDGYRIRTSQYRILYNVEKDVLKILVLRIGHRRDVYD